MLTTLLATAVLTLPTSLASSTLSDEKGKLPWFEGTYAELLAKAKAEDKPIFLDFWTDW